MNFSSLPPLHTHLPDHAGTFCGIVGGTAEQPFAALILLDAKPPKKLNWADACAWGQSLGEGCHVPTRDESAYLYATSRHLLDQDNWLWTSTPYDPPYSASVASVSVAWMQTFTCGTPYDPPYSVSVAWMQTFTYGYQSLLSRSSERLCRAVRLIQLNP